MNLKTAKSVTGHKSGLGKPSKMPGYSTSLPAKDCKVGAKLAKVPGSVCESCYAMKGHYMFPDVRAGLQRRLDALTDPQWVEGMTKLVGHYTDPSNPYFRIHDSGDFQSVEHILNWVAVARGLSWVHIWGPSREIAMIKIARGLSAITGDWPPNLVIRLSAPMIGKALNIAGPTSSVDVDGGNQCPAPTQGNECGDCRACWDPEVSNVNYHKH
jgi:hypothetical protein|tara:strand:+ start:91 stop:729 length:639 start_codon:yes stop_codon:yes gene_type:complete